MVKKWNEIHEAFMFPFATKDIEWRIQRAGKTTTGKVWAIVLAYVDARALRRRLNETVGLENWSATFSTVANGIACSLAVRGMDTEGIVEWIVKSDGAGETDIEAVKGAFSDAFKRACYSWLMGEYLYDLEATFANIGEKEDCRYHTYDKKLNVEINWNPPDMPAWAMIPEEAANIGSKVGKGKTTKKADKNVIKEVAKKYETFLTDAVLDWVGEIDFAEKDADWIKRNYDHLLENVATGVKRRIEDLLLDEFLKPGEAKGMITVLTSAKELSEIVLDSAINVYMEGMKRKAGQPSLDVVEDGKLAQ